jgi:hypothetical protein
MESREDISFQAGMWLFVGRPGLGMDMGRLLGWQKLPSWLSTAIHLQ